MRPLCAGAPLLRLTEDDWNERLGDLEEAYRAWAKAKPKKRRRGR